MSLHRKRPCLVPTIVISSMIGRRQTDATATHSAEWLQTVWLPILKRGNTIMPQLGCAAPRSAQGSGEWRCRWKSWN